MIRAVGIVIVILLLIILLSACASAPVFKPVDAKCSPLCSTCKQLPDWDGDLATAPDTLARYGSMYEQCAARGQACVECVDRLRNAKVIQ